MTSPFDDQGHGERGKNPEDFTVLKELRPTGYDMHKLAILANAMSLKSGDKPDDGPDAEENMFVPAGYTYLGQFVDHDLTFDATSSLEPSSQKDPSNGRTPRFDLDCLYGSGPADRPFMYDGDGATLLYGGKGQGTDLDTPWDLLRSSNGRAIIGDKRNDENSIVCQIQFLFIRFHNKVVQELKATRKLKGGELFEAARNEVRWAYQKILVDDFLPRIIAAGVLSKFVSDWTRDPKSAFLWYRNEDGIRENLPREFVAAAYRFGHSGVRTGYRLNGKPGRNNGFVGLIFDRSNEPENSLVGFDPLPGNHVIDTWARFFPSDDLPAGTGEKSNEGTTSDFGDGGDGKIRLQYAYKLDTTLVDPLAELPSKTGNPEDIPTGVGAEFRTPAVPKPSLALLNLLRGSKYRIQSGQAFAADLDDSERLPPEYLVVREVSKTGFTFTRIRELKDAELNPIGQVFDEDTPLWFYILAEAQRPLVDLWTAKGKDLTDDDLLGKGFVPKGADSTVPNPGAGTQLGPVGGRIVAEVFYGVLESDQESFINAAPLDWTPIWGGHGSASMAKLLQYVGPQVMT